MEVILASQKNDCKTLQNLLHAGSDPNTQDKTGRTALHIASSLNNLSAVQLLLRRGANPNIYDSKGNLPLHLAVTAYDGIEDVIKLLLEEGKNLNHQNRRGMTPLLVASATGLKDIVELLVKWNVNVNAQNNDGRTCLMIAADNGFAEIVNILLDHEADIELKDHNMKDALHYAVRGGNLEAYMSIEAKVSKLHLESADYSESLLVAAQKGHADIIARLVDTMPCDLNYINEMRQSALHIAVQGRYKKTVKVLLQKDITVDRRDHGILGANTALIYAAKMNRCAILRALLGAGADIEKTNVEQKSAMYYGAEQGHVEASTILLETFKDQRLGQMTFTGKEVWHYQSPLQVIMHSPLEAAVINNHAKLVHMLLDGGMARKLKSTLLYAARRGSWRILKEIIRYVRNTTVTESLRSHFPILAHWIKAMALAVTNGHLRVVKIFVENGFAQSLGYDFARSSVLQSKTALHLAAGGGYLRIVRLLLRNHADPEAIDEFGNSPFLYAVEMNKTDVAVHFLTGKCRGRSLSEHIDIHRKGDAALHLASQNGNDRLLDCIIRAGCSPESQAAWPITAGFPPSVENRLSGFHPVILSVIKRNFPATVCLLNHSCSLSVSSVVNTIPTTPLQCAIKFDDPLMFRCLFWSGNAPFSHAMRQVKLLVTTDNSLLAETRDWLKRALSRPMTLQDWARIVIRQNITGSKEDKIKELNIPHRIRLYLSLGDFLADESTYKDKEMSKFVFHV